MLGMQFWRLRAKPTLTSRTIPSQIAQNGNSREHQSPPLPCRRKVSISKSEFEKHRRDNIFFSASSERLYPYYCSNPMNPMYARYAPSKNTKTRSGVKKDSFFLNSLKSCGIREGKKVLPAPRTTSIQPMMVIMTRKSTVQIL